MSSRVTLSEHPAIQQLEIAERAAEVGDGDAVADTLLLVYRIIATDHPGAFERAVHRQSMLALEGVRTGNKWKAIAGFEQLRSTINKLPM
jgi:hypothetical protein